MRKVVQGDLPRIEQIYNEAVTYAESVGYIDWPKPFPVSLLHGLVERGELHCFEVDQSVVASMRITTEADSRIWKDTLPSMYLGKVATSSIVRSQQFFKNNILPAAIEYAGSRRTAIRLDCLSDNMRLKRFYEQIGFKAFGDASFVSSSTNQRIAVTRLQYTIHENTPVLPCTRLG